VTKDDKTQIGSRAAVAHTCNPSYSIGRNQDNHGLKPTPGKYVVRPYQNTAVWGG
jgi:hypothetical protein